MNRRRRTSIVVEDEVDGDGDKEESHILSRFKSALRSTYMKNIPSESVRLLEPRLAGRLGFALYFLIFSAAAAIFGLLFTSSMSKVFLSPEPLPNCVSVDRPVTGTFLGDLNGIWSGTSNFDPSRAPYSFSLQNFSVSSASAAMPTTGDDVKNMNFQTLSDLYRELMEKVRSVLTNVIQPISVRSNFAGNLLYLMTWSMTQPTGNNGNEQQFSFTGSPQSVFQALTYQAAGLGNAEGQCGVRPKTLFDSAAQAWKLTWDYAAFMADEHCSTTLPPSTMGWVKGSSTIDVDIDIRSFFAAAAANVPVPPIDEVDGVIIEHMPTLWNYNYLLKEVYWDNEEDHNLVLGSPPRKFYIGQYFDSRYPGMEAVYCLTEPHIMNKDGWRPRKTCFIKVGGGALFALPIFDSYGKNSNIYREQVGTSLRGSTEPVPCRCDLKHGGPLGPLAEDPGNCVDMDFLSSLLFFPADMIAAGGPTGPRGVMFPAIVALVTSMQQQQTVPMVEQAFGAAWHTAPHLTQLSNISSFSFEYRFASDASAAARRAAFDFCQTQFGGCSLISIRSTASNALLSRTYKSSPGYFSFGQAAFCNFSLYNPSTFDLLVETPPVSLEQDYFRCVPVVSDTFATSFGVALSNTMALTPVIVLVFASTLALFQWVSGSRFPRAFSAAEKDEVLGLLATRMLLQYRGHQVVAPGSGGADADADTDADAIPSPLPPAPTVAAVAAELDLGGAWAAGGSSSGSGGSGGGEGGLQQIYIRDKPDNPIAATLGISHCCGRDGRGKGKGKAAEMARLDREASIIQTESPLPRPVLPLDRGLDSPADRL